MTTVRFERVVELPQGVAACYEHDDEDITVKIHDDLITSEGARVLEQLAEQCLNAGWQPKQVLTLVVGGLSD